MAGSGADPVSAGRVSVCSGAAGAWVAGAVVAAPGGRQASTCSALRAPAMSAGLRSVRPAPWPTSPSSRASRRQGWAAGQDHLVQPLVSRSVSPR